ncbi:hypothetical protein AALA99_09320, partial [Anaerotruncus colihominis]|uniref:hypothetical protein n=1 Tax=Anaerotruncus colihominis TaxID=169435 RepID=UPI0035199ED8
VYFTLFMARAIRGRSPLPPQWPILPDIKKPHALCQRRLNYDCMIGLANTTHSIPNRAQKEKTIFDEFCVFSRR